MTAETDQVTSDVFVRTGAPVAVPPPVATTGVQGWLRRNLFSSLSDCVLTLLIVTALVLIIPALAKFLVVEAVWRGTNRDACLPSDMRPEIGACWAFVRDRFAFFVYGSYPIDQRWRVDLFFVLLAIGTVWLLWLDAPRRDLAAAYLFVVVPIASFVLLHGWEAFGLRPVDTALWGGVLVTIVVASIGIVASLPVGIALALGRRSQMPAVKVLSVAFIELVRGVPLITVLFMASVMLPLFVPASWSPDKLLRALVAVAMFSSAYMAEVVRAGLQAIPRGQYEAARALGLRYLPMMRLIVLPQALKATIPNIVNSYVALFKDTTLVFFVGIFDFLKTIEVARADPNWATPVTSATGYAFAAVFYLIFCSLMSRYAKGVERRLNVDVRD